MEEPVVAEHNLMKDVEVKAQKVDVVVGEEQDKISSKLLFALHKSKTISLMESLTILFYLTVTPQCPFSAMLTSSLTSMK